MLRLEGTRSNLIYPSNSVWAWNLNNESWVWISLWCLAKWQQHLLEFVSIPSLIIGFTDDNSPLLLLHRDQKLQPKSLVLIEFFFPVSKTHPCFEIISTSFKLNNKMVKFITQRGYNQVLQTQIAESLENLYNLALFLAMGFQSV